MGGGGRGRRPSYVGGGGGGSSSSGSLNQYYAENQNAGLKRAFISFHIDDEAQVGLLRHQAKDDRFDLEFVDYSVKEPFDEKWKTQCTERIKQSSVVIVMVGKETHTREAVLWEINKAYELGKPVIGVRIHKDQNHTLPKPMRRNKAKIVNWNMKEIQNSLDKTKR